MHPSLRELIIHQLKVYLKQNIGNLKRKGTVKNNEDFAGEQSRVIGWLLCDSNKLKGRPDRSLTETAKET